MSRGRGRGDFGQKRTLPGDVMQRIQAEDANPREDRLYPPRNLHLTALRTGKDIDYTISLKSKLRCWYRSSSYFNPHQYTDRRRLGEAVRPGFNSTSNMDHEGPRSLIKDVWQPNWKRFPTELNWHTRRVRRSQGNILRVSHLATSEELDKLITDLAEKGGTVIDEEVAESNIVAQENSVVVKGEQVDNPEEQAGSDDDEDDDRWKDLEEDDEEDDIDNDYMDTYFDNGEDFANDMDDGDDREPNYD